jgi:PPK2 family polyphosphate:nucleotide phosphotransferase
MNLKDINPSSTGSYTSKEEGLKITQDYQKKIYDLLYLMFAEGKHALLIILHGIDTSGKDGVVRHLFASANPQGLRVSSFKYPSSEELKHDFFWRCHKEAPERGYTSIFNRSYYEEITTVKIHPEYLKAQNLPDSILKQKDLFKRRCEQINNFEEMLCQNGTHVVKFFLHISKGEQKERLKERLEDHTKNWKFSEQDIKERKFWNQYMKVFGEMIESTNKKHAPWFIVPADKKWYRNLLISKILVETLEDFSMRYPKAIRKKPHVV